MINFVVWLVRSYDTLGKNILAIIIITFNGVLNVQKVNTLLAWVNILKSIYYLLDYF